MSQDETAERIAQHGPLLVAEVPREPTEAMLIAARDWSRSDAAARECWRAMFDVASGCSVDEYGNLKEPRRPIL
jgi:hypothetical protein